MTLPFCLANYEIVWLEQIPGHNMPNFQKQHQRNLTKTESKGRNKCKRSSDWVEWNYEPEK